MNSIRSLFCFRRTEKPKRKDKTATGYFLLADNYQCRNVTRIIEEQMILNDYIMDFKECIEFDLNRHLVIRLKGMKSLEEMVEELEDVDIQKMSGEAMKQCVKFFSSIYNFSIKEKIFS
uniref:BTB domain-containing protein n=2 Tax=Caenorhabditis tropicalis TaxID=1561998 RepID=A0A1I7UKR0_9PELO